jgi:hypothetical protein
VFLYKASLDLTELFLVKVLLGGDKVAGLLAAGLQLALEKGVLFL